ncbi:flavin reductase (NADPH) isoform X2 [Heterocephalus glaber]|uniref:Flavin reductase (NADPH) isoform X2 n=1 Tax=Heterocephalus glaber TaxID=10181 RepID=A0AAX6SHD8_HETGA|nr:flavin reductase (NADPH) isoform X2 [Heterocephalus glaber]
MAVKKIAIFGATGRTGLTTLAQAVQAGYEVTVLVRDPSRLPSEGPQPAHVIVGDVRQAADVDKTVAGQDAVIVLLGTGNDLSPTTAMSEGARNIVTAMKAHGVDKVVACTSAFLLWGPAKVPPRLQDVTDDHIRMHKVLQESGLKYVAVMPPHIGVMAGAGWSPGEGCLVVDADHWLDTCTWLPLVAGLPQILALGKLRQEDHCKFEANLDYLGSSRSLGPTQ